MSQPVLNIKKYFGRLKDPRINRRKRHLLIDIIGIAICAVISGCDDWQQMETFARCRHDWLKRFLRLPNGIPSHDTFERVFERLDPQAFQACFRDWMQALHNALGVSQIAIDGKTLRASGTDRLKSLHLVSAWATSHALSLGQVAVDDKSNEITAIPQLLELLDLNGALVTIDAMGCQRDIVAKIVAGGGDYVLTVKENQPHLLEDIQSCFLQAFDTDFQNCEYDSWETEECGHGRREKRSYYILRNPTGIRNADAWEGLRVIGMCCSERYSQGKASDEVRYFIGSKKAGAKTYGRALRNHWRIENGLHWLLDVTFGEDKNRVSNRHGAENLALVRRLALSLLKQHPDQKSIACKRLRAALDPTFLEEVLAGADILEKI
jgi:predicted transposase YbfD/YdcC